MKYMPLLAWSGIFPYLTIYPLPSSLSHCYFSRNLLMSSSVFSSLSSPHWSLLLWTSAANLLFANKRVSYSFLKIFFPTESSPCSFAWASSFDRQFLITCSYIHFSTKRERQNLLNNWLTLYVPMMKT